jgi:hypothetical protein
MIWAGRIISTLLVLMLLMTGIMKLAKPESVVTEFARLGYDENIAFGLGIVEIACALVYAIPRTSVLGAILLTGYLGGATATHVRIGDSIGQIAAPIIFGMIIWLGLYLRCPRVRALIPLRS